MCILFKKCNLMFVSKKCLVCFILNNSRLPMVEGIAFYALYKAAIKALSSNMMNFKTMYDCRRYLDEIVERYVIHIVWVPGQSGIPGNCKTDELARRGMTIVLCDEFSNLGIPMKTLLIIIIDNAIVERLVKLGHGCMRGVQ